MQNKTRIHADPSLNIDQFDRIPDSLVLIVLNKVADIRALGRCSAVSKRLNSLVPLVNDVYIRIDRVVTTADDEEGLTPSSPKPRGLFSHLLKIVIFGLFRPFHNLRNANPGHKPVYPQVSHHSPSRVLRNFAHVRNLRIELPAGDVGTEDGVLLKWRAEFGSTLQNCVILGGTRVELESKKDSAVASSDQDQDTSTVDDNGSIPESFYTNGGLKLRVVWTISSLIAASTRHYLLCPIINDHPTLRSVVLTDADGQGTLIMGAEQLREFRERPLSASASSNRTQVPASNMKLRYAPYLELPGVMAMRGATLVAIRPSTSEGGDAVRKEAEAFVGGAFDCPLKSAVRALVKRRIYLLEMNGF